MLICKQMRRLYYAEKMNNNDHHALYGGTPIKPAQSNICQHTKTEYMISVNTTLPNATSDLFLTDGGLETTLVFL